ncbi:hypothetical protein CFP56_030067 [Quercus suber]|uniref:Uncharacterized protein n=1 Tax=Quercus suber TaxID=58331 RepID=A0AAW0JPU7_QUESU
MPSRTFYIGHVVYKFLLYKLFKVNGQPIFIRGGDWILSIFNGRKKVMPKGMFWRHSLNDNGFVEFNYIFLIAINLFRYFLRMIFTVMDSILRLVLLGCLLEILAEQQCLKKADRNTINSYPIQSQNNVLIGLNFMEPRRILMIFV